MLRLVAGWTDGEGATAHPGCGHVPRCRGGEGHVPAAWRSAPTVACGPLAQAPVAEGNPGCARGHQVPARRSLAAATPLGRSCVAGFSRLSRRTATSSSWEPQNWSPCGGVPTRCGGAVPVGEKSSNVSREWPRCDWYVAVFERSDMIREALVYGS